LSTEINMNPPTILNENQVQNFIDYIIQKGEMSLDFIKYLTFEWQVNPTQRKILQRLKKIVNIHDTKSCTNFPALLTRAKSSS